MNTIIISTSKHVRFTILGSEGRKIAVGFLGSGTEHRISGHERSGNFDQGHGGGLFRKLWNNGRRKERKII